MGGASTVVFIGCRACIRSERDGGASAAAAEQCITAAQLAAALESARKSVSPDQMAHYDEVEQGFLTGGVAETAVQKAAVATAGREAARQRQELVQAAVARATDSLAARKIAALELECGRRQQRIAALERSLEAAGLPLPQTETAD